MFRYTAICHGTVLGSPWSVWRGVGLPSLLTRPNMVGLIAPFLTGHFHEPVVFSPTRPRTPPPCDSCVPPDPPPSTVSARDFFLLIFRGRALQIYKKESRLHIFREST